MPKGVPIKDHLEEPDFKILYTTLKYSNLKDTDFGQVAVEMGCKDAAFARALYNRTMKAQGKGAAATKAPAASKKQAAKKSTKNDGGDDSDGDGDGNDNDKDDGKNDATGGSAKKRKISATASSEATTEKLDVEDAEFKEENEMKEESGTEAGDGE